MSKSVELIHIIPERKHNTIYDTIGFPANKGTMDPIITKIQSIQSKLIKLERVFENILAEYAL